MEKISPINNWNLQTPDLYTKIAEMEAKLSELKQIFNNSAPVIMIEKLEKLELKVHKLDVDKLQLDLEHIKIDDVNLKLGTD